MKTRGGSILNVDTFVLIKHNYHFKLKTMFTKIVKTITSDDKLLLGEEVTPEQIDGLSKRFFEKIDVKLNGRARSIDCSNPFPHNNWEKRDTKTIFFSKERIIAFLNQYDDTDGLKIYLGMHDKATYPGMGVDEYQDKIMVVLVATVKQIEKKAVGDKIIIAGTKANGNGLDNGKLCPPHPDCK